jgi:hypothetical protein
MFSSSVVEPKIFCSAMAPRSRKSELRFRHKVRLRKSVVNEKEPEPNFVMSAPAPGGNIIWVSALGYGFTTLYSRAGSYLRRTQSFAWSLEVLHKKNIQHLTPNFFIHFLK